MNLNGIRANRNKWLTICFVTYLALLPAYATCYYWMFRAEPQNFAFNADVLRSQASVFKSSTELELVRLRAKRDAFKEFAPETTQNTQPPNMTNDTVTFELPNYKFIFSSPFSIQPIEQQRSVVLTIQERNGNQIDSGVVLLVGEPILDRMSVYRNLAATSLVTLESSISENERRLATLGSSTPEVWSFLDFFYFSVITQTTVGYGDILPNSTFLRMVVVSQVLFGLFIVLVAINLIFTPNSSGKKST